MRAEIAVRATSASFFPPPLGLPFGSERDLRRILDVSGNIRLGEAFPTRWGFATVAAGCPLRRTSVAAHVPMYNGNHVNYRK